MSTISEFLKEILLLQSGHLGFFQVIAAMFVAYLGGILSSLTPCIYPMIPITISVVGGLSEKKESKKWTVFVPRIISYLLGMTLVYASLGVLAGLTGQVFGSLTNNTTSYIVLGVLLTLCSLIMMDIISFDPVMIWNKLKSRFVTTRSNQKPKKNQSTLVGAFFLGATSGFIAAPCTTPVLTAVLAYIAQTQSVFLGFFLMFFFSLGLGTLLVLIAFFTGFLEKLPKSGNWMTAIKIFSGLILLTFSQYLFYSAGKLGN